MTRKIFLLLVGLYFVTRLCNLMTLPIFNDEAFFIWVGRQIASDPVKNLFLNFTDGKEPLFFWLYSLPVKLFPDQLLGIRIFTVLLGFLSLIYFLKIAQKLKLNSFLTSLAFVINPFLLFYERIGMQETLLTLLLLAGTYYLLVNRKILTGVFLGLALLTKTSALAFLVFLIPILLYKKNYLAFLVVGLIYLPVIFGLQNISAHNSSYVGLISLGQVTANSKQVLTWTAGYLGWPLTIFGFPALLPAFAQSLVAKIFFPRYFLFCVPFIILFPAWTLRKRNWLFALLLIPNIFLSFAIIFNIAKANLPYIERWQYLESWPAGYGIKETAEFLQNQKAKRVVVEDIMITKYGLPYYYPNAEYQVGGKGDYYVFDREQNNFSPGFKLVFSYPKVGLKENVRVFTSDQ